MSQFRIGDRVKINPSVTYTPWKGELTGVIAYLDADGTAAVEVESDEKLGHPCGLVVCNDPPENGWWFMLHELKLVGS